MHRLTSLWTQKYIFKVRGSIWHTLTCLRAAGALNSYQNHKVHDIFNLFATEFLGITKFDVSALVAFDVHKNFGKPWLQPERPFHGIIHVLETKLQQLEYLILSLLFGLGRNKKKVPIFVCSF